MEAMCERDLAYLGVQRNVGRHGRGSESKAPIVAAVSLDDARHPQNVILATVRTFVAITDWSQVALASCCGGSGLPSSARDRELKASE